MRDIAKQLRNWRAARWDFAVATVVGVTGSAPLRPGAALAVAGDGEVVGAVSGGCVEGAVYELCREAMQTGRPVLERFAMDPDDAFAVGLPCGGDIEVFVQPVPAAADEVLDTVLAGIAAGTRAALARVVDGPPHLVGTSVAVTEAGWFGGTALGAPLCRAVVAAVRALADAGRSDLVEFGLDGRPCDPDGAGTVRVFVESFVPPPRMLVFGAVDFAGAMARIGAFLGYRVTVCDARPVFTTAGRFPDAREVVVDWPHRYLDREAAAGALDGRTVVCVLTHDAKFDVPVLERALRMPLAYVGALGSRATQRDRAARLRAAGLTAAEIARLRAPIGLDLGGRTAEETAVAVAAEIIACAHGGSGLPLSGGAGAIHRAPAPRGPAGAVGGPGSGPAGAGAGTAGPARVNSRI